MEDKRKISYDLIRIIAIILVLLTHQGTYNYFLNADNPFMYCFSLFVSILCKCGPPLFLMVSGALLLGKNETFKKIFMHRIVRFLIIILLASLWISRNNFEFKTIIINFMSGCNWYLYAYLAFLFMLPFMRKMVQNFSDKDFILFFILSTIFYTTNVIFNILNINLEFFSDIPLLSAGWASTCWHIIFPVFGYWLSKTKINNHFNNKKKHDYTICRNCTFNINM